MILSPVILACTRVGDKKALNSTRGPSSSNIFTNQKSTFKLHIVTPVMHR